MSHGGFSSARPFPHGSMPDTVVELPLSSWLAWPDGTRSRCSP